MSDYTVIGRLDDLVENGMTAVSLNGHEYLVVRTGDEVFIADNRCPHLGGRLSKGTLDGTVVDCHLHHSRFDVRDGSIVRWTDWNDASRAIAEFVRHPRALKTYEVRIDDGSVLIGPANRLDSDE